jgi:hypothetical protein
MARRTEDVFDCVYATPRIRRRAAT